MIDDVPAVDRLTRCPDPAALHARLIAAGPHELPDGRWVVAGAADVRAVLEAPDAVVGFTADPDDPVGALQSRMARFTDGPEHAGRRAAVRRLLDRIDPAALRPAAAARTSAELDGVAAAGAEAMSIARRVPVTVLAEALGVDDPERAARAIADLAPALAPTLDRTPDRDRAVAAARVLGRLLPDAGIAVLFQARDATAGLIGNALHTAAGPPDDRIAAALRHDAPVQLTTRLTTADLAITGRTIPAGRKVVAVLAAAGEPFGAGPHACPGRAHAEALAAGVLEALTATGRAPAYEQRLNLRIPTSVPCGSRRPAG